MAVVIQFPSGKVLQPDSTKPNVVDMWREAAIESARGLSACILDIARSGERVP